MKRSSQVALLLMGVTRAGASSYALIPPRGCAAPEKPAAMAPGVINPQTLAPGVASNANPAVPCKPSRRSSWGRSAGSRGGFGSVGHSVGAHSSGG